MIRAVFFDVDNTLYDFERAMRYGLMVALQYLYERLPDTRGRLTVEHLVRLRDQVADEAGNPGQNLAEVRIESFRRALRMCGHDTRFAGEIARVYFANRFRRAEPWAGTLTALRKLRGRFVLGIISNGNTLPEALGIEQYFDHMIFSEQVGVAKPDPRIFEIAMERVPCFRDELLYVGDSVELDVMGAMNAGARTVWFNPRGQPYPDGLARPDFEISDLSELVDVVERLHRGEAPSADQTIRK